jgi:hypothetical protein
VVYDLYKHLSQENEQLEKLLGEKDFEIAILRDLLKKTSLYLLKTEITIK